MKGSRPLTDREVSLVAQSFGGRFAARDKALFVLGVRTGFRISELLSLKVKDLVQHGKVFERVAVQRRHMKKKVEGRSVVLHPEAKAAVAEWVLEAGLGPDDYLFRSRKGSGPISRVTAWKVLDEAFRTNGMTGRLGTHTMRKTFADRVYTAIDGDLVGTQRALGHRNINSTVQYLSFAQERIDEAILSA